MPVYPKYHPPIDWPYAVAPKGRVYKVMPSPAQRIGKKEARLWGATVESVPYAYEDPYLTSVQDTQYTVDSSMMHKYPYLREGESAPRFPMLFEEPFGSANAVQVGSANYLNAYGYDDEDSSEDDDDFGAFDIGDAIKNAQGFFDKHKDKIKEGEGLLKKAQGLFGKKKPKKSTKKKSTKKKKSPKSKVGLPFAAGLSGNLASALAATQDSKNIPEPVPFSNLFAQAAENDKVNVVARINAGQQVPVLVRESVTAQLQDAEVELTKRAQDSEDASDKLEKSKKKNNMLLYSTIAGGTLTLGLLSYILISRK